MGASNALAEDEELRPLMTDFASGPLEREPLFLVAGLAGLGMSSTTLASAVTVVVGLAPGTTVSVLLRSALPAPSWTSLW